MFLVSGELPVGDDEDRIIGFEFADVILSLTVEDELEVPKKLKDKWKELWQKREKNMKEAN